jgi:GxxExxY protein
MIEVIEKELSYKIIGQSMKIYNELGYGFLEKVYENALKYELESIGLEVKSQYPIKVIYNKNIVGEYIADLLINDKLIIELKAIDKLSKVHEAQLLNYLKATKIRVGLLINFSPTKLEFKKMVF